MYKNSDLHKVIIASAVSSFGASLTWTGLPVFVYNSTGNSDDFSTLFITSTLAGALFTLIGGQLADRFNRKIITLVCSFLSALSVLSLLFFIDTKGSQAYFYVTMISSLVGSMQISSLSAWHGDIMDALPENNGILIAKKNTLMMSAKLLGMGAGPILYTALGKTALILDSATVLMEVGILLFVVNHQLKRGAKKTQKSVKWNMEKIHVITLASLSALLSLPIINIGLQILGDSFKASSTQISLFWLTGALGSLTSNTLMSRGIFKNFSEFQQMSVGTLLMGLSYVLMGQSSSSSVFIACFALHTLGNPIFNNVIGKKSIDVVSNAERGRFLSILYSAQDFGILAVLMLLRLSDMKPQFFYLLAIGILVVRLFLASLNNVKESAHENA